MSDELAKPLQEWKGSSYGPTFFFFKDINMDNVTEPFNHRSAGMKLNI